MTTVTKYRCRVCGKLTAGRKPRNGDGSCILPRLHRTLGGAPCPGVYQEADWVNVEVKLTKRQEEARYREAKALYAEGRS